MPSLAVVERLDLFEQRRLQLEPRGPAAAIDELFLEGREQCLGDGVLGSRFAPAHQYTAKCRRKSSTRLGAASGSGTAPTTTTAPLLSYYINSTGPLVD